MRACGRADSRSARIRDGTRVALSSAESPSSSPSGIFSAHHSSNKQMNKKINAEEVLQLLATIRASVPFELKPRPDKGSGATFEAVDADSIEGFELVTVAGALEDL